MGPLSMGSNYARTRYNSDGTSVTQRVELIQGGGDTGMRFKQRAEGLVTQILEYAYNITR
jgi:hypothetical protein